MAEGLKGNVTLDARGLCCPMPIIRTKKAMDGLTPGDVLEVIATDPGARQDIPAWARQTGNEYLGLREGDGTFHLFIKKA